MQPIPVPHVLDPGRLLHNDRADLTKEEHRSRAQLLEKALRETCEYGQQLWDELDAVRQYLMQCLPPDPHEAGPQPMLGAAPTGPADEQGWANWRNTFGAVTSVLCGPHGDSGYGLAAARDAERMRREVPVAGPTREDAPTYLLEHAERQTAPGSDGTNGAAGYLRTAGFLALAVLAGRMLRPRNSRRAS